MHSDKLKLLLIILCVLIVAAVILAVLSWNNRRSSDGTGNRFDRAYELVKGTSAEAKVFGRSDESILSDTYGVFPLRYRQRQRFFRLFAPLV